MSTKIKMLAMAMFAMLNVTVCAQNLKIDKVEVRGRIIKEQVDENGMVWYDLGAVLCGRNMKDRDVCTITVSNTSNKALKLHAKLGAMVFFLGETPKGCTETIQAGGQTTFTIVGKREDKHPLSEYRYNSIRISAYELDKENEVASLSIFVQYYALSRKDELAFLERNGKWGAIDINQKTVIPFEYEEIDKSNGDMSYGLDYGIPVKRNNKWGLFKRNNRIPCEYDGITSFFQGYALAVKNNKCGAINEYNNIVVPFEYENMYAFTNSGYAAAKKNEKWGVINDKNKVVISFEYEDVWWSPAGFNYSKFKKNGKWGKIDENNKVVTPFIYDKASDVK